MATAKMTITADDQASQVLQHISAETKKVGDSTASAATKMSTINRALSSAKKEAMSLTAQWRALDDTVKNSDYGRNLKAQLDQVLNKAGELQDIKSDVANEIKNIASDTKMWDGAKQGIGVLSSSIQGMASVVGLCGGNVQAFTKALTVMKGVEAATNTIIGIGNALQKDSALMVALRALHTKLLTTATEEQTAAQAANNAMMLANPYVLVTAAIVGLTVAIVAWCNSTEEATEIEKIHEEQTKRNKEAQEEYGKSVASSAGDMLAKYTLLQHKWNECNGDVKLQGKFLKDYAKEIKDVTGRQLDLVSAEDIFVRKTGDVVAAIKARAEAEAGKELYIKAYKKKLENDYNGSIANGRYTANVPDSYYGGNEKTKLTQEERDMLKLGEDFTVDWQHMPLTPKGKEKIRKYREQKAAELRKGDEEAVNFWEKYYIDREKKAAELKKKATINPGGHAGDGKHTAHGAGKSDKKGSEEDKKAAEQSLAWMRNELQERQKALENGWISDDKIEEEKSKIEYLKKNIEAKEIELGFKVVPISGSINDLQSQVQKLQSDLANGLIPDKDIDATVERINKLEKDIKAKKIQLGIEPAPQTDYEKRIDQYVSEYSKYLKQKAIYEENDLKFAEMREEFNKKVQETTKRLNKEFEDGKLSLEQYNNEMDKLNEEIIEFNEKASEAANSVQAFEFKNKSMDNIARHIEEEIARIDKELHENDLDVEARANLHADRAELQKKLNTILGGELSIPAKIEPEFIIKGSADDLRASFSNAQQQVQDIMNDYDIGLIRSSDDAIDKLKEVNERLKALGLKPIKIELKPEWQNALEISYEGLQGFTDSIKGIYDAFDSLPDKLANAKNGFEEFFAVIETGFSVIDSILSFIETIGKIVDFIKSLTAAKEALNLIEGSSAATKTAETIAMQGQAVASGEKVAADAAEITSSGAKTAAVKTETEALIELAAAQIMAAHSSIPFAGPGIGAGLVASMLGTMAGAKGAALGLTTFAEGGIVKGSTTIGDRVVARLNAGEMVLNTGQQAKLFKMINSGVSGDSVTVASTVKVKGSDLYLALNNHQKITGKSLK